MRPDTPAVEGILSAHDVALTASSIALMQEPSGAIPYAEDQHTDIWNHIEGAMALLVGGQDEAARSAFDWLVATQREDGSWPLRTVDGHVEDASGDTNSSAYLAVGLWHDWLVRREVDVVRRYWPVVRRGVDFVVGMQLDWGGICWSQEWDDHGPAKVNRDGLLAGSSSIYHSLRAAVSLAELLGDPQPHWELAGGRLGHALRQHRDLFLDKSAWSMDWYYPVLGGAVRGDDAETLLKSRWDDFVVPGLGVRCVDTNNWVTGAETCELVMALEAMGDRGRALELFADMQSLREPDGSYWTGVVFPEDVNWPPERTTYTAAAVVLAADALGHGTAGSDIYHGATLGHHFPEVGLTCGCPDDPASADRVADLPGGTSQHPE